jgi:hypothetical protein
MEKRGKDFTGLKEVLVRLLNGQVIDVKNRDHTLIGQDICGFCILLISSIFM